MSSGYGRGYYGNEQLDRAPRRRTSLWVKGALVVGVGAIVWIMWPRKPREPEFLENDAPPPPAPPPAPPPQAQVPSREPALQLEPVPDAFAGMPPLPPPQLTQEAIARGYPSQQAYEDAVVSSARQLQDAGAHVALAPHLQHLARRLGPGSS